MANVMTVATTFFQFTESGVTNPLDDRSGASPRALTQPEEAHTLSAKTENLIPVQFSRVEDKDATPLSELAANKRKFVEPEVSFPIDVLEATTFFVLTDSGNTT